MEASQVAEPSPAPVQLSLRIRHPAIDPDEISAALGLEPEHCFKAGDARIARSERRIAGQHTQTYWLAPVSPETWADPIEPSFLGAIAAKNPIRNLASSAQDREAAVRNLRSRSTEFVLFHFLLRMNAHHGFLQKIQAEGGDISLLILIERESAADFTLPVGVTRLLAQLGISLELKFDS